MGKVLICPFYPQKIVYLCNRQDQLQRVNNDSGNDDQVADKFAAGNLFFQDHFREQQDKYIGGGVDDRAIAHIDFCVTPGIQKKNTEKEKIGKDDPPVQIFPQWITVFDIGTLL